MLFRGTAGRGRVERGEAGQGKDAASADLGQWGPLRVNLRM